MTTGPGRPGDAGAALAAARSWLFVPGSRPDRFEKARATGADVVVLDLEDAVAESDKGDARAAVAAWLDPTRPAVVRVNAPEQLLAADLDAVLRPGLAGVMLPKAEDPRVLAAVAARLPPGAGIVPIVESARGVVDLASVAAAPGIVRLAFGSLDLALDLGIDPDGGGGVLPAAAHLVALHSRAAGLAPPVAGVTTDLNDDALLGRDLAQARADGFGGKLCIHPRQVAPANAAFTPPDADVEWAREVLTAAADAPGGVFRLRGEMVDRPVIERARRLLSLADPTRGRASNETAGGRP